MARESDQLRGTVDGVGRLPSESWSGRRGQVRGGEAGRCGSAAQEARMRSRSWAAEICAEVSQSAYRVRMSGSVNWIRG